MPLKQYEYYNVCYLDMHTENKERAKEMSDENKPYEYGLYSESMKWNLWDCVENKDRTDLIRAVDYESYLAEKDAQIKELVEALEFYSDTTEDGLDWDRVNNRACIQDRGKRARAVLEKYRKRKK